MHRTVLTLAFMLAACGLMLVAQTPPADVPPQVHADMNQLMRGVLYPAANVVFSAQADNPGDLKFVPGHDPNMSTDPLTSTFGGWLRGRERGARARRVGQPAVDRRAKLFQRRARADEGPVLGSVRARGS